MKNCLYNQPPMPIKLGQSSTLREGQRGCLFVHLLMHVPLLWESVHFLATGAGIQHTGTHTHTCRPKVETSIPIPTPHNGHLCKHTTQHAPKRLASQKCTAKSLLHNGQPNQKYKTNHKSVNTGTDDKHTPHTPRTISNPRSTTHNTHTT